ncbi:MAG: hypothetical protein WC602_05175 [archaeon]
MVYMATISELRPFSKKVDLVVKAMSKNEIREVQSKLDNSTHKVTEVLVGDESGTILLTLWDDMIEKVSEEKSYKVGNAYTSLFKGSLRLNIGRYGTLEESSEEVASVNTENNISDKQFEQSPRTFSRGYGSGSGGGGGYGGGGGGYGGNRGGGRSYGGNKRSERSDESENYGSDY